MELGSCRVHSTMRLTSLSSPSSSSATAASMHAPKLHSDDADGTWESFPCPFCYVEVEVPIFCTHLQEEHCFDMKSAVCPICAASPGREMMEHMTVHNIHIYCKRRKFQRTNLWTSNLESFQKERYDSSFLGAAAKKWGNSSDSTPDPLLSIIYS